MKTSLTSTILGIIFVISSCQGTHHSLENTTRSICCDDDDTQSTLLMFQKILFKISALHLLNQIQNNPNETYNFTPIQGLYILQLFATFAYGSTLKQILDVLGLDDVDEIACPLSYLKEKADAGTGLTYSVNIFVNKEYEFTKAAEQTFRSITGGQARSVDFSQTEQAVSYINTLVTTDIQNEISNVVSVNDTLHKNTKLAIVSGFKLKTMLPYAVNTKNITNLPFYVQPNVSVQMPYYYIESEFNYTTSKFLGAKVLSVQVQDPYSVLFIVPNKDKDIQYFIKKMKCPNFFEKLSKKLKPVYLQVNFPVYKAITAKSDFMKFLQENLQVPSIFNSNENLLNGLVVENKNISISFGAQKSIYVPVFEDKPFSTKAMNCKYFVSFNRPYLIITLIKNMPLLIAYKAL